MHRVRHKIIVLKKLNIEKQYFSALATLCLGLAACGGVPLHAIPRLLQMQNERLDTNPAEFVVALQVNARLAPPASVVPLLV